MRKRIAHCGQFRDALLQFCDVAQRDRFDLCTGSPAIIPQREQPPDIDKRKAKPPRVAHEPQRMDLLVTVHAISRVGAAMRRHQTDALIVANHLCADA
ncbi:hypothetical protein DFQ28_002021 [Apophysomyces sp. BC1034]|nr:hypothetical protein DFQ28_002021 [Apophysomyces sp. BC1034]